MEIRRAEHLARTLLQALEPSFRGCLGDQVRDLDFIGELYLGLLRALTEYEEVELPTPGISRGSVDELALTAYLVAACQGFGSRIDPELLESLRSVIAGVLNGADRRVAGEDAAPPQVERT